MNQVMTTQVAEMKAAALQVLLHNAHGPFHGLPRTAAWGYPEAYTRDFMLSALGILASGNEELICRIAARLSRVGGNQRRWGIFPRWRMIRTRWAPVIPRRYS